MTRTVPPHLILSCLVVACMAPPADPDRTDPDSAAPVPGDTGPVAEPATATWMGQEIPPGSDDIPLRELLLPGTFNSSSYACDAANGIAPDAPAIVRTLWEGLDAEPDADGLSRERIVGWSKAQDRSLSAQLLDGIRVLDINFSIKDGVLTTLHSVYGEPLGDALDQVVAFAASHPTELVIVGFGVGLASADLPAFADALVTPRAGGVSVCDLLFTGPEPSATATLAQVRAAGRPLIWSPSGELATLLDARGDCPTAPFRKDYLGSSSTTTDGVVARLVDTVATRAPDVFLHNDFFFYLGQSASDAQQASFILKYASLSDALDALGFSGAFPGELIERFDAEGRMNLFSGGHFHRTDLVEAVIARTRTR